MDTQDPHKAKEGHHCQWAKQVGCLKTIWYNHILKIALNGIMGNQGNVQRSKAVKLCLYLYFHYDFIFGDETYTTIDRETPFLGLPAF